MPLDIPNGKWSQADLKVHLGFVSGEILVYSGVAITVPDFTWTEHLWWDLKKVEAQKPMNITELEAFVYNEWAKIPEKGLLEAVSSTFVIKRLNNSKLRLSVKVKIILYIKETPCKSCFTELLILFLLLWTADK